MPKRERLRRLIRRMAPSNSESEKDTSLSQPSSSLHRRSTSASFKSIFRRKSTRVSTSTDERASIQQDTRVKSPVPSKESSNRPRSTTTTSSTTRRAAYVPRYAAASHLATTGAVKAAQNEGPSSHANRLSTALAFVELQQKIDRHQDENAIAEESNDNPAISNQSHAEPKTTTAEPKDTTLPVQNQQEQEDAQQLDKPKAGTDPTPQMSEQQDAANTKVSASALVKDAAAPPPEQQQQRKIVHRTRDSGVADLESSAAPATSAVAAANAAVKPRDGGSPIQEVTADEVEAEVEESEILKKKKKNPFRDSALGDEDLGLGRPSTELSSAIVAE